MKKSTLAVVLALIVVIMFLFASWFLIKTRDKGLEYADGFDEADLTYPTVTSIGSGPYEELPEINSTTRPTDFITPILLTNLSLDAIYPRYGGVVEVSVNNIDPDRDIFIYEFGIIPDWAPEGEWYSTPSGILARPNQRKVLGLIPFPGPMSGGSHSYKLQINLLVRDDDGVSWIDWGELRFQKHSIDIKPMPDLEDSVEIERYHNLRNFFDQINGIAEPYDPDIRNLAVAIAGNYSGNYNIYQVCALFDYVRDNIAYVADPAGDTNYWATPTETLDICGGDCEDHAVLLGSLVMSIGGTARMYMTDTHAFVSIYIGDDRGVRNNILDAIEKYYGATDLPFAWFEDDLGFWLVADTGSSFYLGGLTIDTIPAKSSIGYESLSFAFVDITKLFSVDIIPE
jgi:transglutaminase-like putative cysteine protease